MELKAVFRTATDVNIVVMISGEERATLGLAIGDICSSSRRLIYTEHTLPRINIALALHTTSVLRGIVMDAQLFYTSTKTYGTS